LSPESNCMRVPAKVACFPRHGSSLHYRDLDDGTLLLHRCVRYRQAAGKVDGVRSAWTPATSTRMRGPISAKRRNRFRHPS